MEESKLLKKVCQIEEKGGLNSETILGLPLWRIVRYQTRLYYVNSQTGYVATAPTASRIGKSRIKLFSGLRQFKSRNNLSLFLPFNRLVFTNGKYLDKFIDPVISQSSFCEQDFVIIDPPSYVGDYCREHKEQC